MAEAHLILDSFLEVAEESFGFIVLHLPELHRPAAQVVVQVHGEDGRRAALILRTLLTCRRETSAIKPRGSEQVSSRKGTHFPLFRFLGINGTFESLGIPDWKI